MSMTTHQRLMGLRQILIPTLTPVHLSSSTALLTLLNITPHSIHTSFILLPSSAMGRSGVAAADLLLLIAQNIDVLAGPVVSLAYPLYASIRAIETKNPVDDQQWLTYWILYSMITLFELTFFQLIDWIPFWSYAKLILTCWLVIPQFSGAAYVYQNYVRPFYTGSQPINTWYHVPKKKDVFTPQDDVIVGEQKYIHEFSPDVYQEIIHHSDPEVIKHRSSSFFSEDDYVY